MGAQGRMERAAGRGNGRVLALLAAVPCPQDLT